MARSASVCVCVVGGAARNSRKARQARNADQSCHHRPQTSGRTPPINFLSQLVALTNTFDARLAVSSQSGATRSPPLGLPTGQANGPACCAAANRQLAAEATHWRWTPSPTSAQQSAASHNNEEHNNEQGQTIGWPSARLRPRRTRQTKDAICNSQPIVLACEQSHTVRRRAFVDFSFPFICPTKESQSQIFRTDWASNRRWPVCNSLQQVASGRRHLARALCPPLAKHEQPPGLAERPTHCTKLHSTAPATAPTTATHWPNPVGWLPGGRGGQPKSLVQSGLGLERRNERCLCSCLGAPFRVLVIRAKIRAGNEQKGQPAKWKKATSVCPLEAWRRISPRSKC